MSKNERRPVLQDEASESNQLGHILSHLPRSRKLAVIAWLAADIATSDETAAPVAPTLVPLTNAALEPFGLGVTLVRAWIDSGALRGIVGSRRRISVDAAELIACRDSRPVRPRPPQKSRQAAGVNIDPLDQMLAAGELRRTR